MLTGDSLFVGDVARPDLAVEPREGARRDLPLAARAPARRLPDEVEVWPGHLGGSLCGSAAIDHKTSSTIGFERAHNRAPPVRPRGGVRRATRSPRIGAQPPNVEHVVALNRGPLVEELGTPAPLTPRAVEVAIAEGAILVDARTNEQFDEAHIPGAISASAYDTGFATKVAQVVPADVEVIVVAASDGYELEAAELLASVGLRVRGFLEGGMTAWRSEGAAGRADRDDRPRGARAAGSPGRRRSSCSTSASATSSRPATSPARSTSPTRAARPARRAAARPADRDGLQRRQAQRPRRLDPAARGLRRTSSTSADGGVGTWERRGHPVDAGG